MNGTVTQDTEMPLVWSILATHFQVTMTGVEVLISPLVIAPAQAESVVRLDGDHWRWQCDIGVQLDVICELME